MTKLEGYCAVAGTKEGASVPDGFSGKAEWSSGRRNNGVPDLLLKGGTYWQARKQNMKKGAVLIQICTMRRFSLPHACSPVEKSNSSPYRFISDGWTVTRKSFANEDSLVYLRYWMYNEREWVIMRYWKQNESNRMASTLNTPEWKGETSWAK